MERGQIARFWLFGGDLRTQWRPWMETGHTELMTMTTFERASRREGARAAGIFLGELTGANREPEKSGCCKASDCKNLL